MAELIPFITSMLSLLAGLFPQWTKLALLAQHPSEVTHVLTFVAGVLSSFWLYLAKPHPAIRDPIMDALQWIRSRAATLVATLLARIARRRA